MLNQTDVIFYSALQIFTSEPCIRLSYNQEMALRQPSMSSAYFIPELENKKQNKKTVVGALVDQRCVVLLFCSLLCVVVVV